MLHKKSMSSNTLYRSLHRFLKMTTWFSLGFIIIFTWSMMTNCGPSEEGEGKETSSNEMAKEPVMDAGEEPVIDAGQEPVIDAGQEPIPEIIADKGIPMTKVAFVLNSDFKNDSILSMMTISDHKVRKEWTQIKTAGDIGSDTQIRLWKDKFVILNRFNNAKKKDSIFIFDLSKSLNTIYTIELEPKANPQDIAIVKDKLYVTLYDKNYMMVFEENKAPVKIDLSSSAEKSKKVCAKDSDCLQYGQGSGKCNMTNKICDSDGLPEASRMFTHGSKVYVLIQGLDRADGYKALASVLAEIDTTTEKIKKTYALKGGNPINVTKEPSGTFLITEVGSAFSKVDGGLERFDPTTGKLSGSFIFTEKEANGTFDFSDMVIVSSTIAYALINDASYKQSLIQFNPTTGKKIKELITSKSLAGLALNSLGEIYVGDKGNKATGKTAGIRIFNAQTGAEKTHTPKTVNAKVPPFAFIFTQISPSFVPQPMP